MRRKGFVMSSASAAGIRELKEMAADHEISRLLVTGWVLFMFKDAVCIGSLVMILSNHDLSLVQVALETIECLAKWTDLRGVLKDFLGMQDQLASLMKFSRPSIKKLAYHVHSLLYGSNALNDSISDADLSLLRNFGQVNCFRRRKGQNSFFISSMNKPKVVVFVVRGINSKDDVDACRDCLLRVKGIISITFDLKKKRAILRTRPDVNPHETSAKPQVCKDGFNGKLQLCIPKTLLQMACQVLAEAIAETNNMTAEQVIRNQDGTETLVSFESNSCATDEAELPSYPRLDESMVTGDQNLVPFGKKSTSGSSWSLLRSVGSFLSNSFYW